MKDTPHDFMSTPGEWIGEGRITFTVSPDRLHFYTKWVIKKDALGLISCQQTVEMEGREENLNNDFVISNISSQAFDIELTNELLGTISGKGIIDTRTIAWEFRGHPDFEGFEVYELQDNGDYMLHAEYATTENFRTIVDGRIWKKTTT